MSLTKRILAFSAVVAVLIGFIVGGCYLMVAVGDAIPHIVNTLNP